MSPRKKEHVRRPYGTGSIFQRKDGYWVGRIEAGWTRTGARRRVTVYGKTEADVKDKLKKKQRDIALHGLTDASARTTVKAYADEWIERIETQVRPGSFAADRGAIRNWIVPTIGHKRLEDLTPGDVRAVAKAHRDAGKASSTALRTHATLMKMLRDAVQDGHQVPQRVREVERPVASKSDRDAIPVDDALKILAEVAGRRDGSKWVAALLQGMRQGERLGLTWPLVDLAADVPTFDISWQLQPLPYAHGCPGGDRAPSCGKKRGADCPGRHFRIPDGYEVRQLEGRMHLVRPKTERGQRIIPLVPWMVSALTAWRELAPPSPHGLVWPAADGRPMDAAVDLAEWETIQKAAGVQHTSGRFYGTHEARHTTATLLLEAGIDPEVIKAILGHSSIVSTRSYLHVKQEPILAAMESLAARLQLE